MFCSAGTELWLKMRKSIRSRSRIKVFRKGHRFVESDLRLLLLNKHKKFENDAIARFCCSALQLHRWKQKKNNKNHGNRFNNNIDREYLSVNNYKYGPVYSKIYYISARCRDQTNITYIAGFFIVR